MPKSPIATQHASGTFLVNLTPLATADGLPSALSIAKSFQGDLSGDSAGQMLSFRTAVEGSAGYVAMERVNAKLGGQKGSFTLQHSGTMDRGARTLSVSVVPDSATEQLTGLTGNMEIRIEGGNHFYDFHYRLPE